MFEEGQILVSKHTGTRVRFLRYNPSDADCFEGVELGNTRMPLLPENFHVRWHAWRADAFTIEQKAPSHGI